MNHKMRSPFALWILSVGLASTVRAEDGCETAYAYCGGNPPVTGVNATLCFSELPSTTSNNWGWTNQMSSFPVAPCQFRAGAGAGGSNQCSPTAGYLAGLVTLNPGLLNINLNGWTITELQMYCGSDKLPTNRFGDYITAPGQFGNIYDASLGPSWALPEDCGPGDFFAIHGHVCRAPPTAPAPTAPAPTAPAPTAPAPTAPAPTPTVPAPTVPAPTPTVPAPTPRDFPTPTPPAPTAPHGGDVGGDPHFKTWFGHRFDYQGECDMVLVEAPSFDGGRGLSLHIRTTIHQQENQEDGSESSAPFSFIERAALRIGTETLEVTNDGKYYLNGEEQLLSAAAQKQVGEAGTPFFSVAGFEVVYKLIRKTRKVIEINLSPYHGKIMIRAFRGFLTISIEDATADNFGDSKGLMGSFVTGQMLARDGQTVMRDDPNAFGQEWQVRTESSLFQVAREPQYPQACILPPPSAFTVPERKMRHRRIRQRQQIS